MVLRSIKPEKNFVCVNKKDITKRLVVYIKSTNSNIFISLYKNIALNYTEKKIYLNKLVKTFSCGSFNVNNEKKVSIANIHVLGVRSSLYMLQKNIKKIHIIVNSSSTFRKPLLRNILNTKYQGEKLGLLSLIDITHNSYTRYKIKKDKRR